MADLPVNANISEVDGPHYPARLTWIPRVGELIDLYSFLDTSTNHAPRHFYEVVNVVHKLHDVTEKEPTGYHFVTVLVKRSQSSHFSGQ